MNVKSTYVNGYLHKEVFVEQTKGFEDPKFHNHIYKQRKALHGLKQAPCAWYQRHTSLLLDKGYNKEGVDQTLFVKRLKMEKIIAQIYVDDIVFKSTQKNHCIETLTC